MDALKVATLLKKYGKCLECGNDKVGNGQGKVLVEKNIFTRECKCGFSITIRDK